MLVAVLFVAALAASGQPPQEVLREIRIQGNVLTSDEDVIRLSGVVLGTAITPDLPGEVAARLRATNKFESVEVLKRFASISDQSQIVLVIVVDEGPVSIERDGPGGSPRVVRRRGPQLQYLPILEFEDGYGFAYGARIAIPAPVGAGSRLSFPMTWGGEKRAAAELDFDRPPGVLDAFSRVQFGGSFTRRENPYYEEDDDRARGWLRVERALAPSLRVGAAAAIEHASFGDRSDQFVRLGADVVFDNRIDPMLARNAFYARAAWDWLAFESSSPLVVQPPSRPAAEPSSPPAARSSSRPTTHQYELEARGYVGLIGQSVLVARAERRDSSQPLPPYLRPLLGGMSSVRGLAAGTDVGDTLVAGSLEIMLPLTSPLSFGRLGVSVFADGGSVYGKGERLADQRLRHGAGGAVWFTTAFLRAYFAVARAESSTRVHFGTALTF